MRTSSFSHRLPWALLTALSQSLLGEVLLDQRLGPCTKQWIRYDGADLEAFATRYVKSTAALARSRCAVAGFAKSGDILWMMMNGQDRGSTSPEEVHKLIVQAKGARYDAVRYVRLGDTAALDVRSSSGKIHSVNLGTGRLHPLKTVPGCEILHLSLTDVAPAARRKAKDIVYVSAYVECQAPSLPAATALWKLLSSASSSETVWIHIRRDPWFDVVSYPPAPVFRTGWAVPELDVFGKENYMVASLPEGVHFTLPDGRQQPIVTAR